MDLFGAPPAPEPDDDFDRDDDDFDAAEKTPATMVASVPDPRANPDLAGHADIERTFIEWWRTGTMPHAVILAGAQGIGKATLAFRLARFLYANPQFEGDGGLFGPAPVPETLAVGRENPVFATVASGGNPDLMTVVRTANEKTGNMHDEILVDDVREVPLFLRKTAAGGGWRVVVVDEAETLNRNAQNALLKILEEPPAKSLLLLVTQTVGALIPTIRSRARVVDMRAPEPAVFSNLLRKYKPELSGPDTELLARISGGAPGRALALLDQGGMAGIRGVFALFETLPSAPDSEVWTLAEKMAVKSTPDPLEAMLDLSLWVMRDHARAAALAGDTSGMKRWLATLDALERHRAMCDKGNLDRRHTALGALRILQQGLQQRSKSAA